MNNNFGTWLQQEREKRELSQSALARLAKLNRAVINKIENNTSKPTPETLTSIAHAFGLPPEFIFRKAGLLPPNDDTNEQIEKAIHLLNLLEPDDLEEIIQFTKLKLDRKNSSTKNKQSQDTLARNR